MNKPFIEIQRLAQEFEASRTQGNELLLQLAGLDRDEAELNQRLAAAFQSGADATPILSEVGKLLLDRANLLDQCAQKDSLSANLCRQSAEAVEKYVKSFGS